MKLFNTFASLTASAISHSNRNRTLKQINRLNSENRNLRNIGKTSACNLIPEYSLIGNLCISGGTSESRRSLLIENCKQAISTGQPVVILHENNKTLETELTTLSGQPNYFRVINECNPFYEPLKNLTPQQIASIISDSSSDEHKISDSGLAYLKAIATLLIKCNITPYIRKLSTCPHNSIHNIITTAEQSGIITSNDADYIRNDIMLGSSERVPIEYFFDNLLREGNIICEKTNLARSTSISDCVKNAGLISININSSSYSTLLALISSELEMLKTSNTNIRLILEATSISTCKALKNVINNSSNNVLWTIVTDDIGLFVSNEKTDIEKLLASSHRAILFNHGIRSSEAISCELGEYDYIEANTSNAGNTGLGEFGFHFGTNKTIKPEHKRERVVKAEEIEKLSPNEFIMLDNHLGSLFKGRMA